MKICYFIITAVFLITSASNVTPSKLKILVLPPYDEIANEGISPDVSTYIGKELSKDSSFSVIPFPLKKLMNVPYQNVFDKKYCKAILEKVDADIIIMAKLDLAERTGTMPGDKWDVAIRIYYVALGLQKNSVITLKSLTDSELQWQFTAKSGLLAREIKAVR